MKYSKILIILTGVLIVGIVGRMVLNSSWASTPKISELEIQNKKTKIDNEMEKTDSDDDEDIVNEEKSQEGKRLVYITKSQIEAVTHEKVTFDNVVTVQKALKDRAVWEALGFSKSDAKQIAARINKSSDQVQGILRGISKSNDLSLKIIILEDGHVNLGKGNKN